MKVPKTDSISIQNTCSTKRQRTGLIFSPLQGSATASVDLSDSNNQNQRYQQIQKQQD